MHSAILKKTFSLLFKAALDTGLLIALLALALYFIVPRALSRKPALAAALANRALEKSGAGVRVGIQELDFRSLADLQAKGLEVSFFDPESGEWVKTLHAQNISLLLPPEAAAASKLRMDWNGLSFSRISSSGIMALQDGLRVRDGRLSGEAFLRPLFSQNKILPVVPFHVSFAAASVEKDEYAITNIQGFVSAGSDGITAGRMTFGWDRSAFLCAGLSSGGRTDIFLTGREIDLSQFLSQRLSASSPFRSYVRLHMIGPEVKLLTVILDSAAAGTLDKFDYYDIARLLPGKQLDSFRTLIDGFQRYPYDSARISLELKDDVYEMNYHFKGPVKGDERHLVVPVHIDPGAWSALEKMQLDIFPVFLKQVKSIIKQQQKKE